MDVTRRIKQDVKRADPGRERLDRLRVPDVQVNRFAAALSQFPDPREVDIRCKDVSAFPRECFRSGPADALRGGGNERA